MHGLEQKIRAEPGEHCKMLGVLGDLVVKKKLPEVQISRSTPGLGDFHVRINARRIAVLHDINESACEIESACLYGTTSDGVIKRDIGVGGVFGNAGSGNLQGHLR
ncbi:MAG: hypothetical protein ACRYFU_08535, partial [Janthinobacterium lividum]